MSQPFSYLPLACPLNPPRPWVSLPKRLLGSTLLISHHTGTSPEVTKCPVVNHRIFLLVSLQYHISGDHMADGHSAMPRDSFLEQGEQHAAWEPRGQERQGRARKAFSWSFGLTAGGRKGQCGLGRFEAAFGI